MAGLVGARPTSTVHKARVPHDATDGDVQGRLGRLVNDDGRLAAELQGHRRQVLRSRLLHARMHGRAGPCRQRVNPATLKRIHAHACGAQYHDNVADARAAGEEDVVKLFAQDRVLVLVAVGKQHMEAVRIQEPKRAGKGQHALG